jgi:predicted transcriptional regulator
MRELYMSNKRQHSSSTLKKVLKRLKKLKFILNEKKKGMMIKCPYGKGPSYMMHNSESAIHPMRRFFKQHYNLNLLD